MEELWSTDDLAGDDIDPAHYDSYLENRLRELDKKAYEIQDRDDEFVQALRKLITHYNIDPGVLVVHPGSGTHVGVARVFGKEHVVHVDPDNGVIGALTASDYRAELSKIEEYNPREKAGLMVALNSCGVPDREMLSRVLEPGALIISNNYSGWAKELAGIEGTALVGAVLPSYHAGGKFVQGADIPEEAIGSSQVTYQIEDNVSDDVYRFTRETPNYPDALFVFRFEPNT